MRDRRFVAVHRGGPLDRKKHRLLAKWAADCAEHLLWIFAGQSSDDRPQRAIETGRAWARGEVPVGRAQKAAVGAHAAARQMKDKAAIAVARAAGHAVATAHMAEHCLGVVIYGKKAIEAKGESFEAEREWQLKRLPKDLRDLVTSALERRLRRMKPKNSGVKGADQ
jgi:immunity protein 5 of polymorphic toxin system